MAGTVGIAVLSVIIAGTDPTIAPLGRIGIVTADPDVNLTIPFVMAGDPDCGGVGTRPLAIFDWRRRRSLRADMDAKERLCRCSTAACQSQEDRGED